MSLVDEIGRGIGRARAFAQTCRNHYLDTSIRVVEQGSAGLKGLSRYTDVLGPKLRHIVDDGIEGLEQRLDKLNCSLAEKAVPDDRRAQVRQLRLTPPASRGKLRVVESGRAVQSGAQVRNGRAGKGKPAESSSPAAHAEGAVKTAKPSSKRRSTSGKRTAKRPPEPK